MTLTFDVNKRELVEEALTLGQKIGVGAATLGGAALGANEAMDLVHNGVTAGVEHEAGDSIHRVASDIQGNGGIEGTLDKINKSGININDGISQDELDKMKNLAPETYSKISNQPGFKDAINSVNANQSYTNDLLKRSNEFMNNPDPTQTISADPALKRAAEQATFKVMDNQVSQFKDLGSALKVPAYSMGAGAISGATAAGTLAHSVMDKDKPTQR